MVVLDHCIIVTTLFTSIVDNNTMQKVSLLAQWLEDILQLLFLLFNLALQNLYLLFYL